MTQYYLMPDSLTNGVITRLLEDSWRNQSNITKEDLKLIHQALLDNQMFGEVADSIYVPVDGNKEDMSEKLIKGIQSHLDRGKGEPENKTRNIELFPSPGLILKDGIHGAASGRFHYIYRSKGFRIYWFESGLIEYRTVYSTIDENGYQYSTVEIDSCNIFDEFALEVTNSPFAEAFGDGESLFSYLSEIKADFIRDYPIEYLLYPPDVDRLSSFSIQLREQMWDAIIELVKELALNSDGEERSKLLTYLTGFMERVEIHPQAYHVITLFDFYMENQSKIKDENLLVLLSFIRKLSSPEIPNMNQFDAAQLIQELEAIPSGSDAASSYHNLMFKCLNQIFGGNLIRGKKEVEINEGRKRVDIVFENHGPSGFFAHIRDNSKIYCPKIFIECKNYSSDPKNPEIDQLLGRFGQYTGKFGILVCRTVDDHDSLLKRCKDAMHQKQEFVIYFDDDDIKNLLKMKEGSDEEGILDYLLTKWDRLIL